MSGASQNQWSFWRDGVGLWFLTVEHRLKWIIGVAAVVAGIFLLGLSDTSQYVSESTEVAIQFAIGFFLLPTALAIEMYFRGEAAGKELHNEIESLTKQPRLRIEYDANRDRQVNTTGEYSDGVLHRVRVAVDACRPSCAHVELKIVRLEPIGDEHTALTRARCSQLEEARLNRKHFHKGGQVDNHINAGDEGSFDIVEEFKKFGEWRVRHEMTGDNMTGPHPILPSGDYRITIRATGSDCYPSEIATFVFKPDSNGRLTFSREDFEET